MQHSIAAKYSVRTAARFVRHSARDRERRLGLGSFGSFHPAPARPTVLRRADLGPLAQLRAGWRAIAPAHAARPVSGPPRPATAMQWAGARRTRSERRASIAPAPWRA